MHTQLLKPLIWRHRYRVITYNPQHAYTAARTAHLEAQIQGHYLQPSACNICSNRSSEGTDSGSLLTTLSMHTQLLKPLIWRHRYRVITYNPQHAYTAAQTTHLEAQIQGHYLQPSACIHSSSNRSSEGTDTGSLLTTLSMHSQLLKPLIWRHRYRVITYNPQHAYTAAQTTHMEAQIQGHYLQPSACIHSCSNHSSGSTDTESLLTTLIMHTKLLKPLIWRHRYRVIDYYLWL